MQMTIYHNDDYPQPPTITVMTNNTEETKLPTPEMSEEEIRIAAYYLWKDKGEKHGSDVEDWQEAKESLDK